MKRQAEASDIPGGKEPKTQPDRASRRQVACRSQATARRTARLSMSSSLQRLKHGKTLLNPIPVWENKSSWRRQRRYVCEQQPGPPVSLSLRQETCTAGWHMRPPGERVVYFLMLVSVLSACMPVHYMHAVPMGCRRGRWVPWN